MRNDAIETLLLRHYGGAAQSPAGLEERLCASVRREAAELHKQKQVAVSLGQKQVSRRRAVRLVAIGTAGIGVLSLGLGGLKTIEAALLGQDVSKPAYS